MAKDTRTNNDPQNTT